MNEVKFQEAITNDGKTKIIILTYSGYGDPTMVLEDTIYKHFHNENYYEFIDANMDNPWIRIIKIDL